jgi:hypothetical protein
MHRLMRQLGSGGLVCIQKAFAASTALSRKRAVAAAVLGGAIALGGCKPNDPPKIQKPAYVDLGVRKDLPAYLKDSIIERTDVANNGSLAVTSYGLVVNLRYSGDGRAPTAVREWMIKEMTRHGFASKRMPGFEHTSPESVLADKRTAIVVAGAFIPPGARKGQRVDVVCQALPGTDTASLAGGMLYQCDLRLDGANPLNPGGSVNKFVEARGPLFINPAYALETPKLTDGVARNGARMATVMGGGIVTSDRAIQLRLRTPQWNISRAAEEVINTRFQKVADRPRQNGRGLCVAEAQDEGYINLYVPVAYKGNWEHFVGVVTHLYVNLNPSTAAIKARELCEEAKKPGALLLDISFALEGIGEAAIPYITPLLSHPSADVRFAAARAGAFLGNTASEDALIQIAQAAGNPFRINAILALGELPNNSEINRGLAACLDSDESLVRVNAYRVLVGAGDSHVASRRINDSFWLDMIDCKGPPLVYASRTGEPRLAVFGPRTALRQPLTFSAFDTSLTIATSPDSPSLLSIFYRGDELPVPVSTKSRPNVAELAARLGGAGDEKLRFGYGDIVGILQSMADSGKVASAFVLQDQPAVEEALLAVPDMTGNGGNVGGAGRPVGEPAAAPQAQGSGPAAQQQQPQQPQAPTVGANGSEPRAGAGTPASAVRAN